MSTRAHRIFIVHPSAVFTDSQAHGDGLLAYRFCTELAARGHDVSVACEYVELERRLPANVRLYPLELLVTRRSLARRVEYSLKMRRLFNRLHRANPFDLAHQLNPVYAGLSLGLIGADVPLVLGPYVAHWPSPRASRLNTTIRDSLNAFQQRFADAVLISGPSARSRIVSKHVAPQRVHTVPYGVDLEMFPEQPFPSGDPVILYLAGFGRKKGIFVALAAFDIVAARVPNVRFVVGGDGPERDEVQSQAAASPYRDRIDFIGSVPHGDVPRIFGATSVYCLASIGEPYGMTLIEAMTTGRPVVATNLGGPADLVDPRGGILVPPDDPAALAAALETIVADPDTGRRMGAFNRHAMTAYGWPAVIDRLEAVYATVVRPRSPSPSAQPALS